MNESADFILAPEWIITVDDANRVLRDHVVVVRAGRIEAVVPIADGTRSHGDLPIRELPGQALLPGLVNAHTHAAMTLLRGYADDLPLMRWLQEHIWPAEGRWVDERFVRDGAELAFAELLRGGVTCVKDMYFFPEVTARLAADTGLRAVIGMILLDFPTKYAENADEYLARGLALHDDWRSHPLVSTAFAPHSPYTVSDGPLERVRTYADELDVPIQMHVHETSAECQIAVAESGERPLARLARLGLLSPAFMAVHMTDLLEEEIALLAETGSHVVHCPEANLKLASGFCPVHRLQQAGVNVALGTDGAASNNDLDLFGEMRTAALLAKAVADDATAVPAQTALRMATINGAHALGIGERTGSIEVGKAADLVAFDLSDPETRPVHDVVSQIVYAGNRRQVRHVWVEGRQQVRDHQLLHLNTADISQRADAWRERMQS